MEGLKWYFYLEDGEIKGVNPEIVKEKTVSIFGDKKYWYIQTPLEFSKMSVECAGLGVDKKQISSIARSTGYDKLVKEQVAKIPKKEVVFEGENYYLKIQLTKINPRLNIKTVKKAVNFFIKDFVSIVDLMFSNDSLTVRVLLETKQFLRKVITEITDDL